MSLNQVVKFYVRLRLGRIKTPLFHYVRFKSERVFCSGVNDGSYNYLYDFIESNS